MEKDDLVNWVKKYEESDYGWSSKCEKEVGFNIRKNKFLTKSDLNEIIKWKFQSLPGRKKIFLGYADKLNEKDLKEDTSTIFKEKDELKKIELLLRFKGIGISLASVILTFYNPKDYCIFDIHIWRELFGKEPKNFYTIENYLRLLKELRKMSSSCVLNVRDIEKALFQKNLEK